MGGESISRRRFLKISAPSFGAAAFPGGLATGLVLCAAAFSGLKLRASANSLGALTLPEAFGIPYGAMVLGLVMMAALMFGGAEGTERRYSHLRPRRD